jgi:NADH:ubiquinone oxidoreductase subunit E
MMNLQYLADKNGHTIALQLQIPIEDWDQLKKKYKEFDEVERESDFEIP